MEPGLTSTVLLLDATEDHQSASSRSAPLLRPPSVQLSSTMTAPNVIAGVRIIVAIAQATTAITRNLFIDFSLSSRSYSSWGCVRNEGNKSAECLAVAS